MERFILFCSLFTSKTARTLQGFISTILLWLQREKVW